MTPSPRWSTRVAASLEKVRQASRGSAVPNASHGVSLTSLPLLPPLSRPTPLVTAAKGMSNNPFLNPTSAAASSNGPPGDGAAAGSYPAPDHAPPDRTRPASNYAPTTTATPGQPLLLGGKMLVYPSNWQGCPKCECVPLLCPGNADWGGSSCMAGQDTGYKYGDPSHPCRKCWQSYGQRYNPLLISSAGLQGAKKLQKPLAWQGEGGAGMSGMGRRPGGVAGYPGASAGYQQPQSMPGGYRPPPAPGGSFQSPQHSGGSLQTTQQAGPFRPPPNPPGNASTGRRSPPQVSRAEDAREDNADDDGEAPPAYADAVAAGPDGVLPPQRRDEQGRLVGSATASNHGSGSGVPTHSTGGSYTSPSSRPSAIPGSFPTSSQHHPIPHQHGHHRPMQPLQHHMGPGPAGYGPTPGHFASPAGVIPFGHVPPPGALVLRPGDPRIGGRLCYKCGGRGLRDSLWWGEETCYHCRGSGRIL